MRSSVQLLLILNAGGSIQIYSTSHWTWAMQGRQVAYRKLFGAGKERKVADGVHWVSLRDVFFVVLNLDSAGQMT